MNECNTTIGGFGGLVHKYRNVTKWERTFPRQCHIILYLGPMTYPLNSGDDPDYDLDAGPGLSSFMLVEVCSFVGF